MGSSILRGLRYSSGRVTDKRVNLVISIIASIAVVMILIVVSTVSCSSTTETNIQPKSFLWKVSSDVNEVYILGSVHMAGKDLYPLDELIEDAYNRSEILVVEIDDREMTEEEMSLLLMKKGMYPFGDSVETHISGDLYSKLSERLAEFDSSGFLLRTLSSFEPWVIAITIGDLDYVKLGYDVEYGIDTYFLDRAHSSGRSILQLESVEFQLDLFDNLSKELQIILLEDAVEHPITEEEVGMMFDAWSTGDAAKIERIILQDVEENPRYLSLYKKILDERNFMMTERINSFLQDDYIYFIVVGAAHLVGENGIINLLDQKGYKIQQL